MLDLAIFNNTDSRYAVTVYLFADGEEQANEDSRTFSASIEIDPQETVRREDIAESQRYLVEYDLDKIVDGDPLQTDRDHAHFYPTDGGDSPCVAFDIVGSGTLHPRVF